MGCLFTICPLLLINGIDMTILWAGLAKCTKEISCSRNLVDACDFYDCKTNIRRKKVRGMPQVSKGTATQNKTKQLNQLCSQHILQLESLTRHETSSTVCLSLCSDGSSTCYSIVTSKFDLLTTKFNPFFSIP